MGNARDFNPNKLEQSLLLVTAGITLVFGVLTWHSLLPGKEAVANTTLQRQPAASRVDLTAAPHGTPALSARQASSTVLDVGCLDKEPQEIELPQKVQHLRGRGEWCGLGQLRSSKILNHSNGFSGTVFSLPEKRFTSDYLQLKKGENQIVVRVSGGQGESRLQQVFVKRQ